MPPKELPKLAFGPKKYAALHLMLCRWLRLYGQPESQYCYVTLGGTELRDIKSLGFVDVSLVSSVWSYETKHARFEAAKTSVAALQTCGIHVDLQHATLWSHKRTSNLPHIFFVDLEGVCAWSDYDQRFAELFQNEIIREGDCLLVTSHLGHNPGALAIREHFGGEFAVLGVDDSDASTVRNVYRRAHPTMTLFKALSLNGIQAELSVKCFGMVKYRDTTPMAIYGYAIGPGTTDLSSLVDDDETHYFDMNVGQLCAADAF